jgi:hypothetical protein
VSELDAVLFGACQERHGITVGQLDLREVDGDDTAFLKRGAKDVQVFSCHPAADAKNDSLFNHDAVDSARHGRMACCPDRRTGKPNASWNPLKMRQKPDVESMATGGSG